MNVAKEHEPRSLHLLYHELSADSQKYSYTLSTQAFADHLSFFKELQEAKLRPKITFDDGHRSNLEYALPELAQYGLKAHFFITAGWVGERKSVMDWHGIQALYRAGHAIGAHGWSHALLTHCSSAELKKELNDARALLEDKLGAPVTTVSFPGGRFNRRVLQACEDAGYTKLYTSVPHAEPSQEGLLVGRLNVRADFSVVWLRTLFTDGGKTLHKLERQDRIKGGLKKILGDKMYMSLWALMNRADAEVL
jgi:peptidoglycan/xylan/chitin deacetylase (PgdA/CDA1 family)